MTPFPHSTEVVLPADDVERARVVAKVLAIESSSAPARSQVRVTADGSDVRILVEAEDLRSLRAAANSYLRWAHTALEVARRSAPRANP